MRERTFYQLFFAFSLFMIISILVLCLKEIQSIIYEQLTYIRIDMSLIILLQQVSVIFIGHCYYILGYIYYQLINKENMDKIENLNYKDIFKMISVIVIIKQILIVLSFDIIKYLLNLLNISELLANSFDGARLFWIEAFMLVLIAYLINTNTCNLKNVFKTLLLIKNLRIILSTTLGGIVIGIMYYAAFEINPFYLVQKVQPYYSAGLGVVYLYAIYRLSKIREYSAEKIV